VCAISDVFRDQLESLYTMSVEVAALRDLVEVYDRGLTYCLELTGSRMGFIDLVNEGRVDMDVVAIKGFEPSDPLFFERFRRMPVRPSVFGIVITEERPHLSNDVDHDPLRVGTPPGHPHVHTFLGAPLRVGEAVIGMIGVANKRTGYEADDERLLSTFANQVAVAIGNARLYERQRQMIERLQQLNLRLSNAERDQLLVLERERIAAALHDNIVQDIFTIGLQVNRLLEDGVDDPEMAGRLEVTRRLASKTADEVREVIFALHTPDSGDDLASSVRRMLGKIEDSSELQTDLVVTGTPTAATSSVQGALAGVIKEALRNVVKHAQAHVVLVSIRYQNNSIDVVVQDDGVGITDLALRSQEDSYLHYGMRNMRRQVQELGGSFEVHNGEDSGLTLRLGVPLGRWPA
jgi:signal transduction histidine kinase